MAEGYVPDPVHERARRDGAREALAGLERHCEDIESVRMRQGRWNVYALCEQVSK